MALKSSTFKIAKANPKTVGKEKARLETYYKGAIDKVLSQARGLAEDRRKALKGITNPALRKTASR